MSATKKKQTIIQYNSTLLSRKREICIQRSIKRKKVIKYNRDKKNNNNNKYLKHPNYLPTKSIHGRHKDITCHKIQIQVYIYTVYLITYKLFKKSVGEMCHSEAEST